MSLLTTVIVKSRHILTGIFSIFLEKRQNPKLKLFQYKVWALVEKLEKQLSSKTNFSSLLPLKCSNFRLKLSKRSWSYQNFQNNSV